MIKLLCTVSFSYLNGNFIRLLRLIAVEFALIHRSLCLIPSRMCYILHYILDDIKLFTWYCFNTLSALKVLHILMLRLVHLTKTGYGNVFVGM